MMKKTEKNDYVEKLTDSKTFWKIMIVVIVAVIAEFIMWWAMVREDSMDWWLVTMKMNKPNNEVTIPLLLADEEVIPPDGYSMEDLDLNLDELVPPGLDKEVVDPVIQ